MTKLTGPSPSSEITQVQTIRWAETVPVETCAPQLDEQGITETSMEHQ